MALRYTGEVLYDEKSDFQQVRVLESYKYGKMLTLDNMVMTTEKDEFHYHEMISHPAMLCHGNVKNVLVIGGGDGGTIREVLKHDSIEHVTMVEIDGKVIEACKIHLPNIANSFDHPKLKLIVGDGIEFVKNQHEKYDLIIVDGSDPVGPAEGLFTIEFYQNCFNLLEDKGILVAQGESPKFNEKAFSELNATLKSIFGKDKTDVSLFYVPTYPTGMWSFQFGLKGLNKLELDKEKWDTFESNNEMNYLNQDIFTASFALPNFVKKMINE